MARFLEEGPDYREKDKEKEKELSDTNKEKNKLALKVGSLQGQLDELKESKKQDDTVEASR